MFSKEDLDNMRALRLLMSKGKFEMTTDLIMKSAVLLLWFDKVEKIIEENLKPKEPMKVIK